MSPDRRGAGEGRALLPDLLARSPDETLVRRLQAMPKVELHVHIEGAMTPETVWRLARRRGVPLPAATLEAWRAYYAFRDFDHFIEVYMAAAETLTEPEDFADMIAAFCAYQAAQNIVYCEAFLSASVHLRRLPADELLEAVLAGLAAGQARHGVEVALIPDISREFPETQHEVVAFALAGRERGPVIGLGIGGPEAMHPASLFAPAFDAARSEGLRLVAHAGEAAGAESVADTLDQLHPERIGHGLRALEDPAVAARLRAAGIPLEVCPTSNYRTGAARLDAPHPIRALLNAGLTCTVNSDDPPMFGTSLTGEYVLLADQGFCWDELWNLNRSAIEVSFLSETGKARLRGLFDGFEADV